MLSRLVDIKRAVQVYTSDSGLDSLSSNDWKIAENVVHLLRPFEQITKSMSRDVALLSEVIPTVISLQRYLSKPGQDSGVQTTKEQLLQAVKKRFMDGNASILKDKNMLISSLIDPRFKTAFLEEETRRSTKILLIEEAQILNSAGDSGNQTEHSSVEGSPSTSNSSKTNTDIWSCFTEIVLEGEGAECLPQSPTQTQLTKITSELGSYLTLPVIQRTDDPHTWWQSNAATFPLLLLVAKKYLCAPASSVYSERMFSEAGTVYEDKRNRLLPRNAEKLLFIHSNAKRFDVTKVK
ncbi:zinc finger BED domain-containing protein 4-like [Ciona intestinalis]